VCRSIKVLRVKGRRPGEEEVSAAALQFVRKISGTRKPSRANQAAFDRAVEEIAEASRRLLEGMTGGEAVQPNDQMDPLPPTSLI